MCTKSLGYLGNFFTINIFTVCTYCYFSVHKIAREMPYLIDFKGVHIVHIRHGERDS